MPWRNEVGLSRSRFRGNTRSGPYNLFYSASDTAPVLKGAVT